MAVRLCFVATNSSAPRIAPSKPTGYVVGGRKMLELATNAMFLDEGLGISAMGRRLIGDSLSIEDLRQRDASLADASGNKPLPASIATIEQPIGDVIEAGERYLELLRARDMRLKLIGGPNTTLEREIEKNRNKKHEKTWQEAEDDIAEFVKELKRSRDEFGATKGFLMFC